MKYIYKQLVIDIVMELNIDSNKITIDKLDGESNKLFNERIEFVKKVYQDNKNFKEAINLSKIWINFKYNECRYSHQVYNKLKPYLK